MPKHYGKKKSKETARERRRRVLGPQPGEKGYAASQRGSESLANKLRGRRTGMDTERMKRIGGRILDVMGMQGARKTLEHAAKR